MAKLRAFVAFDLSNTGDGTDEETSEIVYSDTDLVIMETGGLLEYYSGTFTYPDDEWEGVINRIDAVTPTGFLLADLRDIEIDTRVAYFDAPRFWREVLKDDDRLVGSRDADVLIGFSGDDAIRGSAGADLLQGRRGADALGGGRGDDALRGGAGRDVLAGGRGDDALRGEEGRDVFVFGEGSGRDVVRDFDDRRDRIEIEGAVNGLDDLDISEVDGDAHVAFGRTEITLRDVDAADLGPADFLFV